MRTITAKLGNMRKPANWTTLTLFFGEYSLVYVIHDWRLMLSLLQELSDTTLLTSCTRFKVQMAVPV